MFRSYLKLAWRVLWRRKFFTAHQPVRHQLHAGGADGRHGACSITSSRRWRPRCGRTARSASIRARMIGDDRMADEHAGLQAARPVRAQPARASSAWPSSACPQTVYSYPGGQRIKSFLKRTDAEFWRVLDFAFLEGGPFTDQDVANGSLVAVINATTRDRFFGGAAGRGPDDRGRRPALPRHRRRAGRPDPPPGGQRRHLRARSRRPRPTPTSGS